MSDGRLETVPGSIWFYAPNQGAPVFFTVAFAASGIFHLWQCIHYKSFWVTFYLPFCCALFTAGFALREYGAFHYDHVYVYLASTLLVYMSPPILELANYHILGRTLHYLPYFSPIHPGRVLSTLGTLSAVVEILNALGVAYLANPTLASSRRELGHDLLRASLALQLAVITLFFTLAGLFHARVARAGIAAPRARAVLLTLYASMALILARTIYRGAEHFGAAGLAVGPGSGPGSEPEALLSPIMRYEWFFYVFEAAPMLVNSVMWNVRHPRRYLPQSYKVYLAQDGSTELMGPGWGDKRNVVMTFVDPFGLVAMCEPGKKGEQFWESNGYHHLLRGKEQNEGV
ncbi:hypothetical protein MFIFM68171_01670 [Madurella fahalii]|uniref:RTA1 domain protein n=1 Tax=Madurella fahalii TaxID=1157608 RepID=A0ABQ0G1N6_9PEZI